MKTKASSEAKAKEKLRTNEVTMKAYKDLVERGSKQENLSDKQKAIMKEGWKKKRERKRKGTAHNPEQEEERWTNTFKEIQMFGIEMKQSFEMINQCDPSNVIHSAKMTRQGKHTSDWHRDTLQKQRRGPDDSQAKELKRRRWRQTPFQPP